MSLTAAEIISLIEVCSKHNVAKFQSGIVAFSFSSYVEPVPAPKPPPAQTTLAALQADLQETKDWMELDIAPPSYPEDDEVV